jgi:hypothetical protein
MPAPSVTGGRRELPISLRTHKDDPGTVDSSILVPTSCTVDHGVATAAGTFRGNVPELYMRVGAVVELYVYASPGADLPAMQVARLGEERPFRVGTGGGTNWTTTAPVAADRGVLARCEVAVQVTHEFQGAGNVY